jgi:hypothetical protein
MVRARHRDRNWSHDEPRRGLGASKRDPKQHIFVAATDRLATLVLGRAPLTPEAIRALTQATQRLSFRIIASPDRESVEVFARNLLRSQTEQELPRSPSPTISAYRPLPMSGRFSLT